MKSKHLWKQGTALALAAALLLGGISPMEASAAWQRNNIGWWWQQDGGGYPTSSWQLINGTWYYFDEAGYMVEGWLQLDGTWYYLNPGSGAMAEGWLQLDGTWYYLNPGSGAMAEGWLQLGDTWYYLNPGSGAMVEGWLQIGDTWYYLNPGSGAMAANTYIGDYYLDASGAWVQDGSQSNTSSIGATWVKSGNLWWYRHADGGYTANGWEKINGEWYYFDNSGWMVTDWRQIGGDWYYFGSDGAMKTSQWVGNYFVKEDGRMATNQWVGDYYVGADGAWVSNASGAVAQQPTSSSGYYYYSILNNEEKRAYDILLDAVMNLKGKVDIETKDLDVMDKAKDALEYDHPEIFWTDWDTLYTYPSENANITVRFIYNMTKADRDSMQVLIEERVSSLLSGISANASDYEKAKSVFEALVDSVSYNLNAKNAHSIIGSLLDGQSVCEGYAKATQYMFQKLGIPCIYLCGYANNNSGNGYVLHAWNIVCIDGKYYHIDTTWGDPISNRANNINFNYLCATDEEIYRSHKLEADTPFTVPECTSTDFDSYRADGGYFETYDADAIGNYIRSKYENGEGSVSIKLASEDLCNQTYDYFFEQDKISDYCPGLGGCGVVQDPDFYTITFTFLM